MIRIINHLNIVLIFFLVGCTAHYPVNEAITAIDKTGGYRLTEDKPTDRASDLIVMIAFSGGGTRAAAFSYGNGSPA